MDETWHVNHSFPFVYLTKRNQMSYVGWFGHKTQLYEFWPLEIASYITFKNKVLSTYLFYKPDANAVNQSFLFVPKYWLSE